MTLRESVYRKTQLGTLAIIERATVDPTSIRGGTRYVGLEHIADDGTLDAAPSIDPGDLRSTKFAFTDEHVLYGKLRPYLRKVARPMFSGVCSTDVLPIRPGPELDRDFLFHYLRQPSVVSLATARSDGVNLPRISPKTLLTFPISPPPLAEQRQIAAMLDKADGVRRKRREAMGLLDEFLRSVFLEIFGDPVRNEKGWEVLEGGDLFGDLRYGTSVKCVSHRGSSAQPVLRIPNVVDGELNWDDLKYATLSSKDTDKLSLIDGDLLFVRTNGNPDYIARCAVFGNEQPAVFASYLIRGRLNGSAGYRPRFLKHVVSFPTYRSRLVAESRTTAGNYNISTVGLRRLRLIRPSLAQQDAFLAVEDRAADARRRVGNAGEEADALFRSLAQEFLD